MMNKVWWLGLIILFLLLGACQSETTPAAQEPLDPAAVTDAYTTAINAHDVEAALSYVADDAVYTRPAGTFEGKEQIRGFIEGLVAQNVRVELIGERQVEGELVRWMSQVTLSDPDNPDASPTEIVNNSQSTVRNGLIVAHSAERAP